MRAETQSLTGRVVGVHDGDSITVLAPGNDQLKVRLEGIDAPELKQPFSQQSKQALSDLVYGKAVVLRVTGKDRYRRTLAVVMVEGVNANLEMVKLGMAWRFVKRAVGLKTWPKPAWRNPFWVKLESVIPVGQLMAHQQMRMPTPTWIDLENWPSSTME